MWPNNLLLSYNVISKGGTNERQTNKQIIRQTFDNCAEAEFNPSISKHKNIIVLKFNRNSNLRSFLFEPIYRLLVAVW